MCLFGNVIILIVGLQKTISFEIEEFGIEMKSVAKNPGKNVEEFNICPGDYNWAFDNGTKCCTYAFEKTEDEIIEKTVRCLY